jgi:streptomycin 6-kinase
MSGADLPEGVSRLSDGMLEEWSLRPEGPAARRGGAVLRPVRTAAGTPASLKVGPVEPATEHEHLALRRWDGAGAVRLLRADPRRGALLLERLHPEDLADRWDLEACEVVAGLYARLHVPATPQLRRLSSYAAKVAADLAGLPRSAPLPRRLVEQATGLARDLAADDDTDGTLVHGDLHYRTVLEGDREPWLAVDPRPLSGDRHVEPAPMLWHRYDELSLPGGTGVRDGVRRRFHALVDGAGLDEDRARAWVVVRTVAEAAGSLEDARAVTRHLTIAKAVQD